MMTGNIREYESSRSSYDECSVSLSQPDEYGSSTTGGSIGSASGDARRSNGKTEERLAQKETNAVFRLRVLVILVLLIAAAAVSVVVYFMTKKGENDQFESQYEGAARKIVEAFEGAIAKFGGISALGLAVTAHGIDNNNNWPFVTLSAFQQRASTARSQSGALSISTCHLVNDDTRAAWENYVINDEDGWIVQSLIYQDIHLSLGGVVVPNLPNSVTDVSKGPIGYYNYTSSSYVTDPGPGPYLPTWQSSPLLATTVNSNMFRSQILTEAAHKSIAAHAAVLGKMLVAPAGTANSENLETRTYATLLSITMGESVEYRGDPLTNLLVPVFDTFKINRQVVAVVNAVIHWASYFENVLPQSAKGITIVLENACDGAFTYEIVGRNVQTVGMGDLHDPKFDYLEWTASLSTFDTIPDGTELGIKINQGMCPYGIRIYPSQTFQDDYTTNTPVVITVAVAMIFVFTAILFFVYDRLVERRQHLVMTKAVKSSAIVASLFPKNVRERLMQDCDTVQSSSKSDYIAPKHRLKSFLGGDDDNDLGNKPIADLFPHATVLFADIAGFTAWSSTRDPSNVFVLLQTVYQAFDALAHRRRVFKVETIGDSYVAVTGVPEPQTSHAIIMAKFAAECLEKFRAVTRELELSLGPGTGDLAIRVGMHSGPVTAGVLRGERSRFQLFGDTVNTAARMESTGAKNMIQASQATVDLLIAAGKSHWVASRQDAVEAKGKGVLNTYWIQPSTKNGDTLSTTESISTNNEFISVKGSSSETVTPIQASTDIEKHDRLIDWMVELFKDYIKPILARRKNTRRKVQFDMSARRMQHSLTALEEVAEVICLPEFDSKGYASSSASAKKLEVSEDFVMQLRTYIAIIASMYRANPFHNFEHACHVTMSVHKFIQRIATPDLDPVLAKISTKRGEHHVASQLHEYTHGITSDPLTLFAIVFSALIHDVDHRGVSNVQLMKEEEQLAAFYKNKSVAEQNSLSLAWDLLVSDEFETLRREIFGDEEDIFRFRQVVVNVVLATDIFDKELNDLRRTRWEKAFSPEDQVGDVHMNNLRATIVIEHIIQASDVSHTMQHWHIYRKWNMKLFREMRLAFLNGRMGADPAEFWYKGELGFFDNYVIPLANKLKECNVFGVSSDECLNYALRNRAEWEERGQHIIEHMLEDFEKTNCRQQ